MVFFSVTGVARFDASAVAAALRAGTLTKLEAIGLTNLLEGKHPQGLQLKMAGQGKGWKPLAEKAAAYERIKAIGQFVNERLSSGNTVEAAVLDAAAEFGISEPTVYRDLRLSRSVEAVGE